MSLVRAAPQGNAGNPFRKLSNAFLEERFCFLFLSFRPFSFLLLLRIKCFQRVILLKARKIFPPPSPLLCRGTAPPGAEKVATE
jgi:hypothetical protein